MKGLVYLASWPRSGNTLLRSILWQCFGLRTTSVHDEAARFRVNPDWHRLTGAVPLRNGRVSIQGLVESQHVCPVETHDHVDQIMVTAPAIYVVRDGREACVSYWCYLRDLAKRPDVTLANVIRGECQFGGWTDHLRSWRPLVAQNVMTSSVPSQVNVLCLSYEGMIYRGRHHSCCRRESFLETLHRLAEFLGITPLGQEMAPWEECHTKDPKFFRAATNETWRTLMTADDKALFDEWHGDAMREYGYYAAGSTVSAACCERVGHAGITA